MTAARILRGPARVLRRLVRRATKPLRLAMLKAEQAATEEAIAHYEEMRVSASAFKQQQTEHLSRLACKRMAIERGVL